MTSIELKLEIIEEKLDKIFHTLSKIERRLDPLEESCQGMDNHIQFVEGVYTTVRSPLDFVMNRMIRPLMSRNNIEDDPQGPLPAISNQD